jgi:hypothetical protein
MSDNDYIQIVANALTTHGRPYEPEVAARFGLWLAYFEATRAAEQLRGKAAFPLHVASMLEEFSLSTSESPFFVPKVQFSRTRDSVIRTAYNFPAPPFRAGKAYDDEFKVPLALNAQAFEQVRQRMLAWVQESVKVLADQFAQKQGR